MCSQSSSYGGRFIVQCACAFSYIYVYIWRSACRMKIPAHKGCTQNVCSSIATIWYNIALKHKTYVCFIIFSMLCSLRCIVLLMKISFMAKNCDWTSNEDRRGRDQDSVWACPRSEENGNWFEMKGNFTRRKSNNAKQKEWASNENEKFERNISNPQKGDFVGYIQVLVYELVSVQCALGNHSKSIGLLLVKLNLIHIAFQSKYNVCAQMHASWMQDNKSKF